MPSQDSSILIIGAGLFGLTLARELKRRNYTRVTILDRHLPPVPDGSSVDVSRVIRSEYDDPTYAKLAVEAVAGWESEEFRQYYHQSGIMLVADEGGHPYLSEAKRQTQSQGGKIQVFENVAAIRKAHREFENSGLDKCEGYTSARAGWAQSGDAVQYLASQCSAAGVSFITGARGTVDSLILEGNRITGAKVQEGLPVLADQVVVATGAWTTRLLDINSNAVSTAQPVGYVQLTQEEVDEMRNMPIAIHLNSGFFVFPPSPDSSMLKCARHGRGYETRVAGTTPGGNKQEVSAPEIAGDGERSNFLPADAEASLLEGLRRFLPAKIADRGFARKNLCWYFTTLDSDFIVDHHPQFDNLFVATGGSGHAFKFLPVLGAHTCDIFEGTAPLDLRQKWAWKDYKKDGLTHSDRSLAGPPSRLLDEHEQRAFLRAEKGDKSIPKDSISDESVGNGIHSQS